MEITKITLLLSGMLMTLVCRGDASQEPTVTSDKCPSRHKSDLKFSITSHRNQTGHWVAEVRLEHEGQEGSDQPETGLWHVDLDQTTTQCEGVHTVQIVAKITAPSPKPPPGYSAPGYELFPGVGYYKFHKTGKTWDDARKICEYEGGHLVIINSEAESKILQDVFAGAQKLADVNHNDFAFVGFHDRFVEGDQLTIFGKPLESTGFTRWAGPEVPDNAGGNENCGSVYRNGGLNDIPCQWKLAFFCERELW